MLPFPNIDPVAVSIGPLVVRWYALAYVVGLIAGWRWCMAMARKGEHGLRPEYFDEFLTRGCSSNRRDRG